MEVGLPLWLRFRKGPARLRPGREDGGGTNGVDRRLNASVGRSDRRAWERPEASSRGPGSVVRAPMVPQVSRSEVN